MCFTIQTSLVFSGEIIGRIKRKTPFAHVHGFVCKLCSLITRYGPPHSYGELARNGSHGYVMPAPDFQSKLCNICTTW